MKKLWFIPLLFFLIGATTTLELIDEDSMSTDSASRPPSQQSVKAYVAAQGGGSSTHTICKYIEVPTADDDLKSVFANKTAGNWTLTELWGECDQTINWDMQIDDGSPADVSGTDLNCVAGECEDTSLGGDTTLAAGEELDLVITSVANNPTWFSFCVTYTD